MFIVLHGYSFMFIVLLWFSFMLIVVHWLPLVIIDFRSKSTMDIGGRKIKILIWFDNGWGYSSRILETIDIYQKKDSK